MKGREEQASLSAPAKQSDQKMAWREPPSFPSRRIEAECIGWKTGGGEEKEKINELNLVGSGLGAYVVSKHNTEGCAGCLHGAVPCLRLPSVLARRSFLCAVSTRGCSTEQCGPRPRSEVSAELRGKMQSRNQHERE